MKLLRHLIEDRVAASHDQPFLTFQDQVFTYGDLDRLSNRVAHALHETGVHPRDRVAVLLPNSQHFIACWLATIKLNATLVPINTQLRGEPLQHVLSNSAPHLIITTQTLVENVLVVRAALSDGCRVMVMGADDALPDAARDASIDDEPWRWRAKGGGGRLTLMRYESLLSTATDERPPDQPLREDDTAMIIYTSGTTGRAKGVMISRRAQTEHPLYYQAELLLTAPGETAYTYLPLFHVTSMGVTMGSFIGGARLALDPEFNVFGFWDRIRKHNAVVFPYLGAVIGMLYARPPRPDDANNPAQRALGAAAPAAIWHSFEQRFGVELFETYGQTEWGAIWVMHPRGKTRIVAAGKAPERAEVHIVDECERPVASGELGEIVMRPGRDGLMMSGYWDAATHNVPNGQNAQNAQNAARADNGQEPWYHTGDMGIMDADGYLYFKGRLKDYIRRRGENISAFEIEHVLAQHPAILECAAVGVPSDLGEEEVKLCIVLRLETIDRPTPEAIWRYCKMKLPSFMVPRYIELLDELPKTPTQRVRKFLLAERGIASAWVRGRSGARAGEPRAAGQADGPA